MPSRITIQATEDLDHALEDARRSTGRATKSEVIRDGLELYDLVLQHLLAGDHLYLGATRESASEVVLPHLERAAGRLRPALHLVAAPPDDDAAEPAAATRTAPHGEGVGPHAK